MEEKFQHSATIRDYLYILFKRKSTIITFFIVVMIVVITGNELMTPLFSSQAKILIEPKPGLTLSREGSYIKKEDFMLTQVEVLKSWNLMEKVVRTLNLNIPQNYNQIIANENSSFSQLTGNLMIWFVEKAKMLIGDNEPKSKQQEYNELVTWLQSSVVTELVKGTNVITIQVVFPDPNMSAMIANTITEVFAEDKMKSKKQDALGTYNFLSVETEALKNKLTKAEEALKEFKKINNIVSLQDDTKLNLERLSKLNIDYLDTIRERKELERKNKEIRQHLTTQNKEVILSSNLVNNPLINDYKKRLFDLELQLSDAIGRYSPDSKEIEELKRKIREVKEIINSSVEKTVGTEVTGINPVYQNLLSSLVNTETDLALLQVREEVLKQGVDEYSKKTKSIPDEELKLARLIREKNNIESAYTLYIKKLDEANISKNMDAEEGSYMRIIENAIPPLEPISPNKGSNILFGIIAGLVLGLGITFVLEYFDHTLHNSIDVEKFLEIPVLGTVSKFNKRDYEK